MAQPLTIREYEPGDEHQIVELLELVFDGWPHFDLPCTSLEYWRWKYLDNPNEKRTIPVITIGDKVVYTNHGLTRNVVLFGRTFLSSQGTDLLFTLIIGVWVCTLKNRSTRVRVT
jgi:hypothetical protein